MPWIESHAELRDHPKLDLLIELLGLTRRDAVGLLHLVWWRALTYAPDGDLSALTDGQIARWAEWDGDPVMLVEALTSAKFIDSGRLLHDWYDYAGRWVERRQANADRMRGARAALSSRTSSARAKSVQRTSHARAGATGPDLTGPDLTGPDRDSDARETEAAAPSLFSADQTPSDDLVVPAPLTGFHAVMIGTQDYDPSPAFFEQVAERYVALDLREEALKMADWLADPAQNRRQRRATTRFILGWLRKALDAHEQAVRAQRQSPVRNGVHRDRTSTSSDLSDETMARIAEQERRDENAALSA